MENKSRIILGLILSFLFIAMPDNICAQKVTFKNDKSKTYQLRSMEAGKWEFHPGWYYVSLHKKYSGGYWKGWNIKWDVKKSNVGQIEPIRALEVVEEKLSADLIQNQIDSIQPLAIEETARSTERMVDAIYFQYESKFKDAFEAIDEYTTIANTKSNGQLLEDALKIIEDRDLLQAEIDYIHETGPTMQMEQAKREIAYENVMKKLNELRNKSYKLAYYAQTLYNLNQSTK